MKPTLSAIKNGFYIFSTLFLLNSCNSQNNEQTTTETEDSVAVTTAPVSQPKLSDAEIASIAVTANQIDIDYAAIAKVKSKNDKVLEFAATMAKDHQGVIDQAVALVTKLGVTPQDNDVSRSLLSGAAETKTMLQAKDGSDFDKAYVDNEVAYHQAVVFTVENELIPSAQNGELRDLLNMVLPVLKAHLAHAEMIQKDILK